MRGDKEALEEALSEIGAQREEAEEDELAEQLARVPDLTEALRDATRPAVRPTAPGQGRHRFLLRTDWHLGAALGPYWFGMSAQNVEVIQRVYQAAANGDALGLAWLDERFAFAYRSAPELSSGMETVNDPKWRPERYIDLKGRILVQVKLRGRGSESGNEIQRRIGHLWNIRQGQSVRLVVYQDWESGLEAAGVEE